jgi:hypothetical protein
MLGKNTLKYSEYPLAPCALHPIYHLQMKSSGLEPNPLSIPPLSYHCKYLFIVCEDLHCYLHTVKEASLY